MKTWWIFSDQSNDLSLPGLPSFLFTRIRIWEGIRNHSRVSLQRQECVCRYNVYKEVRAEAEMNDSASVSMGTSDVGGCGTVRLYTCLCVSLQRAYLNFVSMTWHAFRNHLQISSWWNTAGQRSLEAIESKYNKEELLLISALVSENGTRRQARFLTVICWLAGISRSACIVKSGCQVKCKQWCIRRGIRKAIGSCW